MGTTVFQFLWLQLWIPQICWHSANNLTFGPLMAAYWPLSLGVRYVDTYTHTCRHLLTTTYQTAGRAPPEPLSINTVRGTFA